MDDEEGYLSKADRFLRKWTGGDYYEKKRKEALKRFEEYAPKTSSAAEATADILTRGAEYSPIGGPMLGMAKKAKTLPGRQIPVFKKNQEFKKLQASKAEGRASREPPESAVKVKKESEVEIIPPNKKPKKDSFAKSSGPKTRPRLRAKKEANKFGPLVKREEKVPAVQNRGLPAVYDDRGRQVRTFGDNAAKSDKGRIVGLSPIGKAAVVGAGAGLGALGYALAPEANKAGASGSSSGDSKVYGGARPGESTRGYGKAKPPKPKPKPPMQGAKPPIPKPKPANRPDRKAAPNTAGDKFRATKKMTNFERMKQSQYEKEGFGGRSLTAEGARKRVMQERKYKLFSGFKPASSKAGSYGSSNRSKLAADFRKKLQGRAK